MADALISSRADKEVIKTGVCDHVTLYAYPIESELYEKDGSYYSTAIKFVNPPEISQFIMYAHPYASPQGTPNMVQWLYTKWDNKSDQIGNGSGYSGYPYLTIEGQYWVNYWPGSYWYWKKRDGSNPVQRYIMNAIYI